MLFDAHRYYIHVACVGSEAGWLIEHPGPPKGVACTPFHPPAFPAEGATVRDIVVISPFDKNSKS